MLAHRLAAIAGSIVIATVGGCSNGDNPPDSPTISNVTSVSPHPTVPPPITHVLDISPFFERPCNLLTQEQIKALEVRTGTGPNVGDKLHWCSLSNGVIDESIDVSVYLDVDLLGQTYQQSTEERPKGSGKPRWATFESGTIAQQPVVVQSDDSVCEVVVGTGPKSGISVVAREPGGDSWCPKATKIAEQIVGNLTRPT